MAKLIQSLCVLIVMMGGPAGAQALRAIDEAVTAAFERGELKDFHGLHVVLDGEVIADVYAPGADNAWGRDIGVIDHGPETLHDIRSVSKTVVALLYGIALDRGLVPPPESPLYAAFPAHADLGRTAEREAILVRHALTMTMGLAWDETLPYTDPNNSEIAMERAADRVAYALSRPVVSPPGEVWTYSGGATTLIGALIEEGTGQRLDAFAREVLFAPLGITAFEWQGRDADTVAAASGLRLRLPDLAKIGVVLANNGRFGDQTIVSKGFLDAMFTPRTYEPSGLGYGYFTYISWPGMLSTWRAGFGNGGQRLLVHPVEGLVMAVSAGRYEDREAWRLGVALAARFVYPEVRKRLRERLGRAD